MAKEENIRLQDTDTEDAILGLAMMKGNEVIDLIVEKLTEEDFTLPENRVVFATLRDMFLAGYTNFDEITVGKKLYENGQSKIVGGKVRLTSLQAKVPYPPPNKEEAVVYVEILKDKTVRRKMFDAAVELQKAAYSPETSPLDGISLTERTLMTISEVNEDKSIDTPTAMQNAFEFILDMYNGKPPEGSVMTGVKGLDNILVSINPSDFVILGARPSMGKTAFATNILENVAMGQGKFVALYSLEMSSEQIGARMILSQSGISSEKIRRGELTEDDILILEDARDKLQTAPFIIDDRAPLDIANIVSRTRKLKAEKNLGLVIIDYLQLMTGTRGSDGRQQEVSDISRALKLLAKELKVPIIALSQLNRSLELRNDKRPQMSDLRESGSLEQDADIIMFLYRDDYYHPDTEDQGITEAIVAKHRNGKLGTAKMFFNKDTTHFYDLDLSATELDNRLNTPPPERQKKLFDEKAAEEEKPPKKTPKKKKSDQPVEFGPAVGEPIDAPAVVEEEKKDNDILPDSPFADDGPPTAGEDGTICF